MFGFSRHIIGGKGEPLLEDWLHPVLAHAESTFAKESLGLELARMALSVGGAIGAWFIAKRRYGAATGRSEGFDTAIKVQAGMTIVASRTGGFNKAQGYTVAKKLIAKYPNADVIYTQNDEMAFGAIQALEEAGKGIKWAMLRFLENGRAYAEQPALDGTTSVGLTRRTTMPRTMSG